MGKKMILFVFTLLVLIGCDVAMDQLDVRNGAKYIVTSKKKKVDDFCYTYHLIKEGDRWYDYHYIDTADFNIGDTLVLTIQKVKRK